MRWEFRWAADLGLSRGKSPRVGSFCGLSVRAGQCGATRSHHGEGEGVRARESKPNEPMDDLVLHGELQSRRVHGVSSKHAVCRDGGLGVMRRHLERGARECEWHAWGNLAGQFGSRCPSASIKGSSVLAKVPRARVRRLPNASAPRRSRKCSARARAHRGLPPRRSLRPSPRDGR